MYQEIENIVFQNKLSKAQIAFELGVTYNTLLCKLRGENQFTLDQALKLKEILNTEKPIEELFSTDTKSA